MTKPNCQLLKTVQAIHQQITAPEQYAPLPALPHGLWQAVTHSARGIVKAQTRGWQAAARAKRRELVDELDDLQRQTHRLLAELQSLPPVKNISTPGEIYQDLVALTEEHFEVSIDLEQHLLSVTTEPIVLEDIDLGRFQICLDWQRLPVDEPYRVVALDPHPAARNHAVTHPHVNDETLCEGEGQQSIHRALAEGRLLDFFMVVDRLLHTYARGRAHIELDHWQGRGCQDCGSFMDEDDYGTCDRCEEATCLDCLFSCTTCDRYCCSCCSNNCASCDERTCNSCLEPCDECQDSICPNCVHPNNHKTLCTTCHENQSQPKESETEESAIAADAAVHADRLGQTAALA